MNSKNVITPIHSSDRIEKQIFMKAKKIGQIKITVNNEFRILAKIIPLLSSKACNIERSHLNEIHRRNKISTILINTNYSQKLLDLIIAITKKLVFVYFSKNVQKVKRATANTQYRS